MLNKSLFTIFISSLIISGCSPQVDEQTYRAPKPIHTLLDKEASLAIATGIEGSPFVIGSLGGAEQAPCSNTSANNIKQEYTKKVPQTNNNTPDCVLPIANNSLELSMEIENTKKPIIGTIIKDGKEVQVKFYRVLIAANSGSYCTTIFSGGEAYQKCVTQQQTCESKRQFVSFVPLAQFLIWEPQCEGHLTE